ncbi:MAG: type II toxin-antitoxin system VapC family toxin [Candidatus Daviesbacteria bacterium]|nr:type II toxin-antitoxin system VapC family toxin [Candidatus Daviesbacteria bacterium]
MAENTNQTFVLDASFILAFLLPDERNEQVMDVFKQYSQGKINFIASKVLPFEVANSLKNAIPKRVSQQNAIIMIENFLELKIEFMEADLKQILNLSLFKDLSVYDASYLYLAQSQNFPLLTLDKKLQKLSPN